VTHQTNPVSPAQTPHFEAAASSTTAPAQSPITLATNTQAGTTSSGQLPSNNQGDSATAASATATSITPAAQSTPATVAANSAVAEPTPPAEAPSDEVSPEPPLIPAEKDPDVAANEESRVTESVGPRSTPRKSSSSGTGTERARTKKSESIARTRTRSRIHRAVPAEADAPRGHPATIRARVLSITPNGNVVLMLPSGERAIVAPQDADHYSESETIHRRPRRVIIERRTIPAAPEYPPPYQPFIPGD
jgi:hypothetical protein